MWGLVFVGQNYLFAQGNESVLGAFMFGGMALLILGVSLLFFTLTIPFERLSLLVFRLIAPRLTYFAMRNVLRAKRRNTVIALMIVFSATLPTFLGTTAALTVATVPVALITLDPVLFGVVVAPGRPLRPGEPAAWFVLAAWNYSGER